MHTIKTLGLSALLCFCGVSAVQAGKKVQEKEAVPAWENLQLLKTSPIQTSARSKALFNEGWLFQLGDNPDFRETAFKDASWRKLHLPHDWSIETAYNAKFKAGKFNGYFSEGIGWYRKHFKLSKEQIGKQLVIQFDGVFSNSEVYINGQYLGRRPNGYATFRYDLTNFVKPGVENVIAVRVDNSHPGATRWYNGSGIYRNVYMLTTNFVHFRHDQGVYVTTPVVEKEQATINVDYRILGSYFNSKEAKQMRRNHWLRDQTRFDHEPKDHACILRSTLYDKEGNQVAQTQSQEIIRNYTTAYGAAQDLVVENPKLWSDKSPYLYYLKSELLYEGKVLDDVVTTVGLRKLEFRSQMGFYVNNENTYLKGVCIHHAAGALGAAVPMKVRYYRMLKLKEMGCNAIRTAHNPYSPDFFALCDAMGFYVMNEAFDEWQRGWQWNFTENNTGKAPNGYNMIFDQWWKTDLRDMMWRDRNHPSVIMWGVGNEIPQWRELDTDNTAKILAELKAECEKHDSTRPVTLGNNEVKGTSLNGVNDQLDVLGFNYIERDYGDSVMYKPVNKQYPNKLCFGSETKHLVCYWNSIRDNKNVFGQFIWTGFDYLGETHEKIRRGARFGLMDLSLQPKETWAQMSACWSEQPKVSIMTSLKPYNAIAGHSTIGEAGERIYENLDRRYAWNWKEGDEAYVIIYNNCDYVKLYKNGRYIGKATTDKDDYYAEFKMPYKAGRLKAVGYRNNKAVCHDMVVSTEGDVAGIDVKAAWDSLDSSQRDQNILEISLVDKKGGTVFAADNKVTVEVSGGARLAALDSGNLYYLGMYNTNTREAHKGKLLLTIESNLKKEPVVITLTSPGLPEKRIEIPVK